jgi:hypothetical protein
LTEILLQSFPHGGFCNLRRLKLLTLFCALSIGFPLLAQPADFQILTSGPHHVVQGHFMYFLIQGQVLTGTSALLGNGVVPTISGLPGGATAEFVTLIRFCCLTSLWTVDTANPVKISTSLSTQVGAYPLTIVYVTAGGLLRSTTYTIFVDPMPTLTPWDGLPYRFPPSLTGLGQWTSDRVVFGRMHCTPNEAQLWETNAWYYDGERVYYQIADATGDPSWNACALLEQSIYRPNVLKYDGWIAGYEVFPHGLAMNFKRTGDPLSRQAVVDLGQLSTYSSFPNADRMIDWSVAREVAYGIEAGLVDQGLGSAPTPNFQDQVEMLLGDFDQWFISKNAAYVQPFMVGLAAEALIQYWDVSRDPRVTPLLQLAADQLWLQSWNAGCACFLYYNGDGTTSQSQDLNLLIAPLYGWVFQQTGSENYRTMGDQIFNSGVTGAWLYGGKQFSQNYRWSDKYVQWRSALRPEGSAGNISANPNPCVLSANQCTSYINWKTTGTSSAQVWVKINNGPESLYGMALSCSNNNCAAPWIQGTSSVYTFTLYDCDGTSCNNTDHGNALVVSSIQVTGVANP